MSLLCKPNIGAASAFLAVLIAIYSLSSFALFSAEKAADAATQSSGKKAERRITDPHLDKTPPRETKGLDLVKLGWRYDCMECHKSLEAKWEMERLWVEHKEVHLQHGNNKFCLNCHHPTNRNAFKNDDGSEIEEKNVVQLCARCHGTTHRDWLVGVHGRQNGHWDAKRGEQTKLRCIQCHDPHHPKFPSLNSLPAPRYPKRAAKSHSTKKTEHK